MLGSLPRHLVLSLHLPRPKGSVRFGRDDDEAKEERKEPRKRRDEPNRRYHRSLLTTPLAPAGPGRRPGGGARRVGGVNGVNEVGKGEEVR